MKTRIFLSGFLIFTLFLSFIAVPFPALAQQGSENANRYIVILNEDVSPSDFARDNGLVPEFVYEHAVKGFAGPLSPKLVEKLSLDSRVKYVEKDQKAYAFAQTVPNGIKRINPTPYSSPGPVNAVVAIIDTGINLGHPDLNVNTAKSANCSGGGPFKSSCKVGPGNGEDGDGHGTHVAGTVGALDNDFGVVGVAPGVELWAVKVLSDSGSGYISWIVAGIDYVTANAATVDVANMSLGCECSSQALDDAITKSVNAGVTYVVAAGNSKKDASTFSPANHPLVLTVSAIADFDGVGGGLNDKTVAFSTCTENHDDSYACFSNFGSKVELAAPGVSIYSTYKNGGYATLSGTSMASPHVTGAVAKYIAENGRDADNNGDINGLDVQQIIQSMINNAKPKTDANYGYNDDEGHGSIEPVVYVEPGSYVAPSLTSISIDPVNSKVTVGQTLQFSATGHYDDQSTQDLTNSVTWVSSIDNIATISSNGLATGISAGSVVITATLDTFSDSTSLTVNPVPSISVDLVYSTSGGKNSDKHLDVIAYLSPPLIGVSISYDLYLDEGLDPISSGSGISDSNGQFLFSLKNAPSGTYTTSISVNGNLLSPDEVQDGTSDSGFVKQP